MHLIQVDDAYHMMLATRFLPGDEPWTPPLFRLQLRTTYDAGVILDFRDPRSVRFFAAASRTLLDAHRAHEREMKLRTVTRPTALHFDCF
jgi:hypothetical protein